ncbi:MAG: glycosyltransferase [Pseudomonadota bacterium]|nr:glycosyltransferase [Pseudomonadota bacterium]
MGCNTPLRVGVLVDLERGDEAGGHVKCWEHFAKAAVGFANQLNLTVHFQGNNDEEISLGPQTRIITLRPLFSTKRLFFLRNIADYTDLAPGHPRLKKYLKGYDVIHTTDGYFAYAQSAARFSRKYDIPLVNSVHTDTPGFTKVYSEKAIRQVCGKGILGRLLIERLRLPERFSKNMQQKLVEHTAQCRATLSSEKNVLETGPQIKTNSTQLRRGIDKKLFHPSKRNPNELRKRFGIPEGKPIIAFVGRLDGSKNVMTLAKATKLLLDRSCDLHLILAGKGYFKNEIGNLLGDSVTFAGTLASTDIALLNASCDLFVFPSTLEIWPNAVLEAKASGAAILVAPGGGDVYVEQDGQDGLIIKDPSPKVWAHEIEKLLNNPDKIAAFRKAARHDVETKRLTWADVLEQDLIPVWRSAAETRP